MLDTNICIYIIKQQPESVLERFLDYQVGDISISAITLSELRYGVAKSKRREKNAKALDEFVIPLEILPFDEEAAQAYGDIRTSLEKAGTPLRSSDFRRRVLWTLDFALWTLASGARGAQRSSAASNGLFATISPLNR